MKDEGVDAMGFVQCSDCGGKLHPIQPGTTAPEYYCPTTRATRQLRAGDKIVALIPKDRETAAE